MRYYFSILFPLQCDEIFRFSDEIEQTSPNRPAVRPGQQPVLLIALLGALRSDSNSVEQAGADGEAASGEPVGEEPQARRGPGGGGDRLRAPSGAAGRGHAPRRPHRPREAEERDGGGEGRRRPGGRRRSCAGAGRCACARRRRVGGQRRRRAARRHSAANPAAAAAGRVADAARQRHGVRWDPAAARAQAGHGSHDAGSCFI